MLNMMTKQTQRRTRQKPNSIGLMSQCQSMKVKKKEGAIGCPPFFVPWNDAVRHGVMDGWRWQGLDDDDGRDGCRDGWCRLPHPPPPQPASKPPPTKTTSRSLNEACQIYDVKHLTRQKNGVKILTRQEIDVKKMTRQIIDTPSGAEPQGLKVQGPRSNHYVDYQFAPPLKFSNR